jgi:hypothetical protein
MALTPVLAVLFVYRLLEREKGSERFDRIRAAADEIDRKLQEKYGERLDRLRAVRDAAERELAEAKAAAGAEALDGLPKGTLVEQRLSRFGRSGPKRLSGRKGRYEIRTPDSAFPANRSWGLPEMGKPFIRLLKKDGTPGLGFEATFFSNWRPEEPTP